MELTRLYAPLATKFKDGKPLDASLQPEYEKYLKLKSDYEKEFNETKERYANYEGFLQQLNKINSMLKMQLKVEKLDVATLSKVNTGDENINKLAGKSKKHVGSQW